MKRRTLREETCLRTKVSRQVKLIAHLGKTCYTPSHVRVDITKFNMGQLVVKKTGGPAMTVTDDLELECTWVAKGRHNIQHFQPYEVIALSDWIIAFLEGSGTTRPD